MPKTLKEHLDPANGPKRILALDGGGVKGILTLGMLESLEAELRRRAGDPKLVLSDYFDLIGGTSTGAIVAAGLAVGKSVKDMIALYGNLGPMVFGKTKADGVAMGAKYDIAALKKALRGALGYETVGSDKVLTGLAIHTKRIDTGSAWMLTNHPDNPYYEPAQPGEVGNKDYPLVDVVMASAAAPTFFDEVKIPMTYKHRDKPKTYGYFVDGAVGGYNNPGLQLLMTATVPRYGFGWKAGEKNLMIASYGTGARRPEVNGNSYSGRMPGLKGVTALRSMIWDSQMQAVMVLQTMSNPVRSWPINGEVLDLDGVCISPEPMLDYQRVDVRLDKKGPKPNRGERYARTAIEALLDRELDKSVLESVDQLANGHPQNMSLLLEIGRRAGPGYIEANSKTGRVWPNPHFNLPGWAG
jgi:hypothetical protein